MTRVVSAEAGSSRDVKAKCTGEVIATLAMGLVTASQKAGKPLFYGSYPITPASEIAESAAAILPKLGRTFLDTLILAHMAGETFIVETAMAKYWTTDMVKRIADRALDYCGSFGTLETCQIARAWRDVRVMSIFAGTNEIMKGIAAKFMGL